MSNHEQSVLILDSKNSYKNARLNHPRIKITSIERSHELGLKSVEKVKPDILVKIINDNDRYTFDDTIKFLSEVRKVSEATQVLVVNVENNKEKIYKLIDLGVNGVFDGKSSSLLDALVKMQQYRVFISFPYQKALLEEFQNNPQAKIGQVHLRVSYGEAKKIFTNREIEIVDELASNDGNYEERAKRLFISPKTLKNHMIRIMDKLYAENRTHIIPLCIKKGIIDVIRE